MSLADFNIAKFNIPISIKRAFDKGKIADSYRQMYVVAEKLAAKEATTYMLHKGREHMLSKIPRGRSGVGKEPSVIEVEKQVLDYKNERLDHHMQNMIHLLEIYAAGRHNAKE